MISHARTETGKLVISRSEISDEMRRINASQGRILNRRLEVIERQERTAQANHTKTIKRAVGDQDPKSLQQARGGATVDFLRRDKNESLPLSQLGASLDLAQYDAIRSSRSIGESSRFRGQRPQGAEQSTEPSPVGHQWNGQETSLKTEGLENGGIKTWNTSPALYPSGRIGRSEVSLTPRTQRSLAANVKGSSSARTSPSRPR